MGHFTIVGFCKGAVAATLACCVALSAHAQMRLAADKISPEQFDQKLQDTRAIIKSQQAAPTPPDKATGNQISVNICKKMPQLPQCKL